MDQIEKRHEPSLESEGHKYFHADMLSDRKFLVLDGDSFHLRNV